MKPIIYIAGAYTKGDVAVNVRNALRVADYLCNKGVAVPFVPHLTHFWHLTFPRPYEFWVAYDLVWLEKCDAVIRITGESSGADGEVKRAKALDIPVHIFSGFEIREMETLDAWLETVKAKEPDPFEKAVHDCRHDLAPPEIILKAGQDE